ncbi:MAG: sugar ABC transporter ATP-binding protein [Candidatus Vecturithrix sp.]|jgi:ribose transport system ATP-binding protein|nr:sugar ABC transporter ATP-binding protein [Candidatus Vecturithrix sp.]
MEQSTILAVRNITKTYPGVKALDNVTLDFKKGEIHAIAGENGAGKSTLIKILTGAIQANSGEIELEGVIHTGFTPHQAQFDLGIAAIYQEFNLVPELSVAENIFFGKEVQKGVFLDTKRMQLETERILEKLGISINPRTSVKNLSVAYRQIVEIAKAVSQNVKILIMDEPSAPLTANEITYMFQLVRTLKAQGVTIIYISHRLTEVFELADRVTVLRDGTLIATLETKATDRKELITLMVGRELGETYPEKRFKSDDVLLEVNHLNTPTGLKDISFRLHKGEILGFGGLVGAGRTELARAIFGADQIKNGEMLIERKKVLNRTPSQAVEHGIGLIPEDRKQHGILAEMSVKDNISFSSLKRLTSYGLISGKAQQQLAMSFKEKMRIATPDLERKVKNLSGGNQQKVVLAKWLATQCDVIIFDEPTRGIDVGAKQEIYELISQLAEEGKGIIFISSEMPELLGMSDRILVMREGEIVGELHKGEATQRAILELASAE